MLKKHPDIIDPDAKEPETYITRPTNRSPDNPNVIVRGPFYKVSRDMDRVPLGDYLQHGFETRKEFIGAVAQLMSRWQGRKGECIEERVFHDRYGNPDEANRMLLLRFHDTPGGSPDEALLPAYLCEPIPTPVKFRPHKPNPEQQLKDEITARLWEGHTRKSHKRK